MKQKNTIMSLKSETTKSRFRINKKALTADQLALLILGILGVLFLIGWMTGLIDFGGSKIGGYL
jgi:hypothetical protein